MKQPDAHARRAPVRGRPLSVGDAFFGPAEGFWALAGAVLRGVGKTLVEAWRWFWAAQHRLPTPSAWTGYELRLALAPDGPAHLTFWVSAFSPDEAQANRVAGERLRWALATLPQYWQARQLSHTEMAPARGETPPWLGVLTREPGGRHGEARAQADMRPPAPTPWRPSPPKGRWAALLTGPGEPVWLGLAVTPTVLWPAEAHRVTTWSQPMGPCPDPAAARWRAWQRRHARPFLARLRVGTRSPDALAWGLQALVAALTATPPARARAWTPRNERDRSLAQANWQRGTLHPWETWPLPADRHRLPYLFAADDLAHLTLLLTGALP